MCRRIVPNRGLRNQNETGDRESAVAVSNNLLRLYGVITRTTRA